MTEKDNWEPQERAAWHPRTPKEEREALGNAPLATLRATPTSEEAFKLMGALAKRYARPQSAKGKSYAREKTIVKYANASGAFVADLLAAASEGNRSEGWLRCSLNKSEYTGQDVSWSMFDGVRRAWLEAGLLDHKAGYPGRLAFGNPGPTSGKMTRHRATLQLLKLCGEYCITPENVTDHFRFEYEMPRELVQLTNPFERTPTNDRTEKLRAEIIELNEFFAQHTLAHPTIKHQGWVRKFHRANHPDFRWNKGGRLYSYPTDAKANYQNVDKSARLEMKIDGEPVVEIDIGSSYLTIFYAWNDEQLDPEKDAYKDILGDTEVDRVVAKAWINASFGNAALLSRWSKDLKKDVADKLDDKGIARTAFDPKRYPMKMIKERVLQRHPLLERWGGQIRGRVRDWGDLMFVESQVIIGAMLQLKRDHRVPSMPVHDSLIVPFSKRYVAEDVLVDHFRKQTGVKPRLEMTLPEDLW